MFRTIIVEDEQPGLELMKVLIGRSEHYQIVGAFLSPLEALAALPGLQPDIAFIDVEMPKMNGVELAKQIVALHKETKIVFTTAYKEYAVDAFEVEALHYVLKPVTPAAIEQVTARMLNSARRGVPAEPPAVRETLSAIRCFGRFEIRSPKGEVVRFTTRKAEELFAYFLCHPERVLSKWELAELLWPDTLEERAGHNLHNTIYILKKLLKECELGVDIRKTNEGYILDVGQTRYDVLEFQRFDFGKAGRSPDVLQEERLVSMYRGPLLEGKPYLWKMAQEEQFGKQYTVLMRSLVLRDFDAGNWIRAEERLDAYLAVYPLQEEMNELLIDLYIRCGSKEKLARHYAKFEAAFRKELGLEPSQQLKNKVDRYLKIR